MTESGRKMLDVIIAGFPAEPGFKSYAGITAEELILAIEAESQRGGLREALLNADLHGPLCPPHSNGCEESVSEIVDAALAAQDSRAESQQRGGLDVALLADVLAGVDVDPYTVAAEYARLASPKPSIEPERAIPSARKQIEQQPLEIDVPDYDLPPAGTSGRLWRYHFDPQGGLAPQPSVPPADRCARPCMNSGCNCSSTGPARNPCPACASGDHNPPAESREAEALLDVDWWERQLSARNGSDRGMAEFVVATLQASSDTGSAGADE